MRLLLISLFFFFSSQALASDVYVSELFSGTIISVDSSGNKQPLSAIFGRPAPIAFDRRGSLYIYDHDALGVYRMSHKEVISWYSAGPLSSASLSRSVVDITVTKSGKVLLLNHAEPDVGSIYSEVWMLNRGHSPKLLASTLGYAPEGQTARGFVVGSDKRIYLAMQGGESGQGATARVMAIDHKGNVSTYYDSGVPIGGDGGVSFIDVRFDASGVMYLLVRVHNISIPGQSNPSEIWKVVDGSASVLVPAGLLGSGALQMDIDSSDHLFVSGGGHDTSVPNGFLFDVAPSGNIILRAEFPPFGGNPFNPIKDVAVVPDKH